MFRHFLKYLKVLLKIFPQAPHKCWVLLVITNECYDMLFSVYFVSTFLNKAL